MLKQIKNKLMVLEKALKNKIKFNLNKPLIYQNTIKYHQKNMNKNL